MCICVCVPFIAVHLPLCVDMGSFSAAKQCSFYSLPLSPLSVSPSLSLFLSSPLSRPLSSNSSLLSLMPFSTSFQILALLGEAELPSSPVLSPLPSSSGAFSFPFCLPLSLFLYTFFILFPAVSHWLSIFLLICISVLPHWCLFHHFPSASLSLCHCLCLLKVGQTWKQSDLDGSWS